MQIELPVIDQRQLVQAGASVLKSAEREDGLMSDSDRVILGAAIEAILTTPEPVKEAALENALRDQEERWKLVFPQG